MFRYKHASAAGNISVGLARGNATLATVNVNTGAASATLTIYDGVDATGRLIAVIDASSKSSQFFGVDCPDGIFAVLAGGNADVTIGYT